MPLRRLTAEGHITLDRLPSLDNFFQMVELKTSRLFRLSLDLYTAIADPNPSNQKLFEQKETLTASINAFGTGFQVLDDLNSVNNPHFATLKGSSDDLREGKLSFPILLFFRDCADWAKKERLEAILNARRGSPEDLAEVRQLLVEGGE